MNSGLLTLLAFLVLGLFGVVAHFSLRKHVRGIQAPTQAEVEAERLAAREQDAAEQASDEPTPDAAAGDEVVELAEDEIVREGKRSPKASDFS